MAEPQAASAHRVLERNIDALLQRERQQYKAEGAQGRLADAITRFAGSLPFVYVHAFAVAMWIVINAGLTPLPRFDPTFVLLATIASVEAIFLTAFVLMAQNRMQADADRRADLDVHISLLTEHELTNMARLLSAVAKQVGVENVDAPELKELRRDVQPEHVLDALDKKKSEANRA